MFCRFFPLQLCPESEAECNRNFKLQSTMLSVSPNDVTEEAVYKCVGQPQPSTVKEILRILLDKSIRDAVKGSCYCDCQSCYQYCCS